MSYNSIEEQSVKLNNLVYEITSKIPSCDNSKKQLLRACTSIGANKAEAKYAESCADLVHKLKISLKECAETKYWLETLLVLPQSPKDSIKKAINICGSIERKLVESLKTAQK